MKGKRAYVALGAIAVAIGFLVFQGLGNASEYFKTTDEAVAQQNSIGSKRFRLEGTVVEGTVCTPTTGGVHFLVESNGKKLGVKHDGDPPELFRANIPVVLSGSFDRTAPRLDTIEAVDGPTFRSDLVMIKHSNDYIQKNKDRVGDYVGKDLPPEAKPLTNIPTCT
jgi:cytochrome c-type biogenesis protein CcmE